MLRAFNPQGQELMSTCTAPHLAVFFHNLRARLARLRERHQGQATGRLAVRERGPAPARTS